MPTLIPSVVPWIERVAARLPGVGEYLERGRRRSDNRVIRDAAASRLRQFKPRVDRAIEASFDRGVWGAIATLERCSRSIDRLADRLRASGTGTNRYYSSRSDDPVKADPLQAVDLNLLARVDALEAVFDTPGSPVDLGTRLERELAELDAVLNQRARIVLGISSDPPSGYDRDWA